MPGLHPCLSCGACCATYRVSFYAGETSAAWGIVPDALTEPISPSRVAMIGTNTHPPRCVALEGEIGRAARCSIHPLRPQPCRDFAVSYEHGTHEPRCDEARARHGLPPLRPEDWSA